MGDPFELVIFDCDGVLVDSERLAVRVESRVLAELGWPLTEAEIVERFIGRTGRYMDEAIEAQLGEPAARRLEGPVPAPLPGGLRRRARPGGRRRRGARPDRPTPTCVASSGSHDKMRFTLGLTGLYQRFAGRIFSAYEVAHGKPAPDLFLHAAGPDGGRARALRGGRGQPARRPGGPRGRHARVRLRRRPDARPSGCEGAATVVFDDMRELPAPARERSRLEPAGAAEAPGAPVGVDEELVDRQRPTRPPRAGPGRGRAR